MKPPCVILAGGRSSRMGGGDKCLLPLGGQSLIARIARTVAPQASGILINSNSSPTLFADLGLPVRADVLPGFQGPLAGILTGMFWARQQNARHLLSVACDTPFLPHDLAARLTCSLRQTGADIAIARDPERVHPVIGLWKTDLADQLAMDLQTGGVRAIYRWLQGFQVAETEFDAHHFRNINTPVDLEAAGNVPARAAFFNVADQGKNRLSSRP